MIVLKFGGTSVADRDRVEGVLDIAAGQLDRAPVLVSSAMGKTTDALLAIGRAAAAGDETTARAHEQELLQRHNEAVADLGPDAAESLMPLFRRLDSIITGLVLLRDLSPRIKDTLLSFGELLSTRVIHARARARGIEAELLDSRELIRSDDAFTEARVDRDTTRRQIQESLKPRTGALMIAQGFIASCPEGGTTTIGRGGSDYTAALLGEALAADEVQIWTDVDGILTTDPRIVPEARSIDQIRYEEAAELAYFGAKVVHPSTIIPAVDKGIPVRVLNTLNPTATGTLIKADTGERGIRAIAGKKGITMLNVSSSRMLNAYGFLSRLFGIFERYETPVDLIATSEVSVSMTIDDDSKIQAIRRDLAELGETSVESDLGIVSLVGKDLWKSPRFISRSFSALGDIPVKLISQGASVVNLSLVVPETMVDNAIKRLHGEFFA